MLPDNEASSAFADYLGAPEEARGNRRLVFDEGNQFTKPGQYGMFFAIPTWWRGFIFHVLKPRDFATYAYICAQTDVFGIAYPTGDHIKADMDRSHNTTVYSSVGRLEKLGFILKDQRSPITRYNTHRNIYQRPTPEFTLIRLLELKVIDGYLKPSQNKNGEDYVKRHGRAIDSALEKILSPLNYKRYVRARPSTKADVLKAGLLEKLEERRKAVNPTAPAAKAKKKRRTRKRESEVVAPANNEPAMVAKASLKRVPTERKASSKKRVVVTGAT